MRGNMIDELDSPTPTWCDDVPISHSVTVYADIGGYEHSSVIADEVTGQLRTGPEFAVDGVCDLVVPADTGAFGNELLVSIKFSQLADFVHAVEASGQFA